MFDSTLPNIGAAVFAGVRFKQDSTSISTDMDDYIQKTMIRESESFDDFASNRAKLGWIVYCRPDICSIVAQLAQVTKETFESEKDEFTEVVSNTMKHVKSERLALKYAKLDLKSLFVRAYCDASFGANEDGS
eukprot:Plantae.Rhodophyta-Palmaria_palmata.ctg7981.p1 GENE.Plantae.Rhodophyta-Palmaria_palmata.ctg7981~~Plantae.Rhodophyta-Palmaria_palmata.ctg7981.p1  ORF type:complete len:154 (-),score=21.31 Plantae.Rhodophyta-Palmaria_palmata.ctg7981:305-703(-)